MVLSNLALHWVRFVLLHCVCVCVCDPCVCCVCAVCVLCVCCMRAVCVLCVCCVCAVWCSRTWCCTWSGLVLLLSVIVLGVWSPSAPVVPRAVQSFFFELGFLAADEPSSDESYVGSSLPRSTISLGRSPRSRTASSPTARSSARCSAATRSTNCGARCRWVVGGGWWLGWVLAAGALSRCAVPLCCAIVLCRCAVPVCCAGVRCRCADVSCRCAVLISVLC